jgi:hypothetical protein
MRVEQRHTWTEKVAHAASPWLWSRRAILALGVVIASFFVLAGINFLLGWNGEFSSAIGFAVGAGIYWLILGRPYVRSLAQWRARHRSTAQG